MSSTTRMETSDMKETSDTKIEVGPDKKTDKIGSNVIECSLNMNLSLPKANKRSKIFQRAQSLVIVILAIIFAIVCFHLKQEVRALKVQINCVNTNLMMLMLRYDKLNKNFNRIWYHGMANHHRLLARPTDPSRQLTQTPKHRDSSSREEVSSSETSDKDRSTLTLNDNISPPNSTYEFEKIEKISRHVFESDNVLDDRKSAEAPNDHADEYSERERYERAAIVAFEKRNQASPTALSGSRDETSDDANTWNESRTGRYRRDEGRGKKRRKIKRRLKRSRRRLGPLVATFVGAVPEQHVTDTVYVGPWVKSTRNESRYSFNKFHLVEDKTSIEVTANGLYMVSAQIYYFGEPTHYSYWILLTSEGSSNTRKVIKCATVSAVSASEASCYTSVVLSLRRGDRLHIQQQERDRLINLREGHSYVQIMLLSSDSSRRRGT
ncbi:uncharacterized protein [Venturia canescens]|uniref:uncharacterized protein isoform X2 n=1 Tax=Venturia canescens TaxID=32260 RepID=UPI001C9C0321|nr:uncharacterized protein LOC122416510 isoform X2 [Venturia canescens]